MSLIVVVLAGAVARRMGGAKPLRRFGRSTLIEHALRLARGYGAEIAISLKDPAQGAGADARLIFDRPGLAGPLGGLAAGLADARRTGAERVLVFACDMPLLPDDLARRLAASLNANPRARVAMASSGGKVHPACALWTAACLERLPLYLATGRSSLRGFAETCGAAVVAWPAAAADPFANANTPDELAALQAPRFTVQ